MKNFKNNLSYAIAIIATLLFISCSGDDGALGPAGANGKDGNDGSDGNANVTTVVINNRILKNQENNIFTVNGITQDIIEYGAVLTYMRVTSDPSLWYSLPYFNGSTQINVFSIKLNEINIKTNSNTNPLDIKFVIIAGNNANASKNAKNNILSTLENNGIDVNDYNQVAEFYNLEH